GSFLGRLTNGEFSGTTFGFGDKKVLRPLQTADLWSYESRKRIQDGHDVATGPSPEGSVRLRASLQALIGNDPNMMEMSLNEKSLPVLVAQARAIFQESSDE